MSTRLVFGVGLYEKGEYTATYNRKNTKVYNLWKNMLMRCYSDKYQDKRPSYIGCSVCHEWHNFQTFASWAVVQAGYGCEEFQLDKDLVSKGNKVYSPENCVFVPTAVNLFLINRRAQRGNCLVGVSWYEKSQKYRASLSFGQGAPTHLGYFNTEQEAFDTYKSAKELFAKELAAKFKNFVDERVYNALVVYRVNLND